jgi:hypothetical protein
MANLPLPLKSPPASKTSHGATKSTRMARVHVFMGSAPWHVGLDFNTDDGMQYAMQHLIAARAHVVQIQEGKFQTECNAEDIRALLADIDGYIARVPSARVDSVSARKVTPGAIAGMDAPSTLHKPATVKQGASSVDALMAGFLSSKFGKK